MHPEDIKNAIDELDTSKKELLKDPGPPSRKLLIITQHQQQVLQTLSDDKLMQFQQAFNALLQLIGE
jgi:hypothetical protein